MQKNARGLDHELYIKIIIIQHFNNQCLYRSYQFLSSSQQPLGLSRSQTLFIAPDNFQSLAVDVDDSIIVEERAIRFGTGTANEILFEVPLGFIDPHATIRVTVGLDDTRPSTPGADHDPVIGLTDGSSANEFRIHDINSYPTVPPCTPVAATSQDDNRVTERTHVSAQVTLIFRPIRKFGSCFLPMDGGYINTATFSAQLDSSRALSLRVRRSDPSEQYRFHYFLVEVL